MHLSTISLQKRLSTHLNQLPLWLTLVAAWLAGAIFLFALSPYGFWPLAIVSPAILYALLVPNMSGRRAFIIGEAYGMGLWCVGGFWLYTAIHDYSDTPTWLALIMIALMGLGMGLFHGLLALVFNRMVGKQPFSFAALWVLQEWLKTWLFTGFPWLFVGYAFTEEYWLSSLAPVAGVFAVSFVAILLAASLVELLLRRSSYAIVSVLLLAISTSLWLVNPQWTKPKGTPDLSVSLIQGNISQDIKWLTQYQVETLKIYAKLTRTEWGRDVVVWPESSIPMFQDEAAGFISEMIEMANATNTTWITGIPYKDKAAFNASTDKYPPFYNSVIAIDGVGALKVTAAWNGAGTVKLTILSSNLEKASSELINIVQEAFDPNQDGKGDGLAPIGHIVTVDTPQEVAINIKCTLTYATGQSWDTLGSKITKAVNAYLESLRKQWADNDLLIVRIAMIEAAILSVDGVLDITNTTINDGTSNIEIGFYEIPILGDIECTNS